MDLLAVLFLGFIFLLILVIGILLGGAILILSMAKSVVKSFTRWFDVF